jgi:hypothetical protein
MDIGLSLVISAGGIIASVGVAWGLLKATVGDLKDDVREVKGDVKGLSEKLERTNDRVNTIDKSVAVLAAASPLGHMTRKVGNG